MAMTKWLLVIMACLVLSVSVAACGGDDDGGGGDAVNTEQPAEKGSAGGGGGGADTSGGGAKAPAGGKGKEVVMKDIQFAPGNVTVKTGETVTWKNDDSVGHDVHAEDGSFASGDPGGIQPGTEFKHEFDKAGTFKYVCEVHPGMEGEVVVK